LECSTGLEEEEEASSSVFFKNRMARDGEGREFEYAENKFCAAV